MILYPRFAAILPVILLAILPGVVPVSHAAGFAIKIETSRGEFIDGTWAGVTEAVVRVNDGTSTREIPLDQVVALRPATAMHASAGPKINVTLTDGTSIFAQDLAMDAASVKIEPLRQAPINLPIKQIRSIRFRLGGPVTDPQWLGLVEQESRTDLMVIRRSNDQLDPIEGIVVGLSREKLQFELDGDKLDAPLERLEGILFRTSDAPKMAAKVQVADIYGSTFLAARLEPSDKSDSVEIMLPGNLKHVINLNQIQSITWSSGRIMLAGQSAASLEMTPYLATGLPSALIKGWFGPIADGEDLIAAAGGKIEYRVEDGFQTFAGSVQRDEAVAVGGTVLIRVLVDGELKWEQSLSDLKAKGFRIPIGGALRLRLEVSAGKDGDVGDQVRFLKPRLLK